MSDEFWKNDLLPHQVEAVEFLASKTTDNGHAGLFDDLGLGKTLESIRAADVIQAKKILVVCPAVARINWQREFEQWQQVERTFFIVRASRNAIPEDVDVIIISYDLLASKDFQKAIAHLSFDLIIADEAHMAKNRNAARTKAFYGERIDGSGIVSKSKRVWILTGTPMPNNAAEIYTHLRALAPTRVRVDDGRLTYVQFVNRFCHVERKQFGMRVVERILGNKNVDDLRRRLKGFYIRRKKEDVLKDLPLLQWGTIVLEPDVSFAKEIKKASQSREAQQIQSILAAAAANHKGDGVMAEKLLEFLDTNKRGLASLRRLLGLAKIDPVVEFVDSEMENPGKMVLFCYHRDVITELERKLKRHNPVVITGDTDSDVRQEYIDRFQNDPETRIFIGQITATNAAITLTASDNVLLVEPSWNPAENAQAAARTHRIGQKSSCVVARYVVLAGSLDEVIVKVLLRKTKQISEIML
jgi:SNF2 family DNA or RNA helicase